MIFKKGTREIVASNKLAREVGAVPGRTCFKTCAMRDDNCPFCLAPKLWTTGQSQRLEVEYRGTWYEGIWAPLSEDLYVHYIFDITERKRVDREIRLHAAIMNNVAEGIYMIGLDDLTIKWTNERFARMFGYEPGEMDGKQVDVVNAPTDITPAETRISIVDILKETGEWHGEVRNIKQDGTHFWCYANVSLFDHPEYGKVIVSVHTNITEGKQAEGELAKHRDRLEELVRERTAVIEAQREQVLEASRMKSEFLATMSHELRTPLSSIMALSQLMLSEGMGNDPERDTEFLQVIERNGHHLLDLINDILDLSSIEAGQTRVSPGEFALDGLVERILTVVRPMAQAKDLRLEVDLADIPTVYSDRERIGQILLNLLGNAVKFTEAGQVAVSASESGGMISLSVADTGVGISPDVLPHVFDSFRQADGSSTRKYEGSGLGLAISQELAELLGGQITVTSEVGKGSTFTLRLPVRMADGVQAEGNQSPPEAGRTVNVTGATDADPVRPAADRESETATGAILVVEDNADNLLATTVILEHLGYQCITAVNGELALAAARTHAPALILMDIQLPEMDGLEATRRIKADAVLEDIPIVALTTRAMKGDREKILTAGCDDYMSKPVDPAELGRILRKWLGEAVPAGKYPMKCQ